MKEEVLTEILELAKIAYIDGKALELVISETEKHTIQVDGGALNNTDLGVFITNSFEDRQNREKVEQLVQAAVNQGKASLLDMAEVITSDSMSYMKDKLA